MRSVATDRTIPARNPFSSWPLPVIKTRSLAYRGKRSITVKHLSVKYETAHIRASRFEIRRMQKTIPCIEPTEVSHEAPDDLWSRGDRRARCRNHHAVVALEFDRPSFRGCKHDVVANRGRRKQA